MYVRTKKGEIFDCYECEQMHKPIYYPKKSKTNGYIDYEDIYKKSDNLIDILGVGDYVNGSKVLDIAQAPKKAIYTEQENGGALLPIENNRIESILTKEKFESMEYKL